jgi:hypothetical protein
VAALATGNHVGWRPRLVRDPLETSSDVSQQVSAQH